ncbi:MAG: hypothetical protein ABI231_09900 [Candidatus Tumulicola sp.]
MGALLGTQTHTFFIPYRPSKNDTICTGPNLGKYLNPIDQHCDNGLAAKIAYNMRLPKLVLPAQAIVCL